MANFQYLPNDILDETRKRQEANEWAAGQRAQLAQEWAANQRRIGMGDLRALEAEQTQSRQEQQLRTIGEMDIAGERQWTPEEQTRHIQETLGQLERPQQAAFGLVGGAAEGKDPLEEARKGWEGGQERRQLNVALERAGMPAGPTVFRGPVTLGPLTMSETDINLRDVVGGVGEAILDPLNVPAAAVTKPGQVALKGIAKSAAPVARTAGREAVPVAKRLIAEEAGFARVPKKTAKEGAQTGTEEVLTQQQEPAPAGIAQRLLAEETGAVKPGNKNAQARTFYVGREIGGQVRHVPVPGAKPINVPGFEDADLFVHRAYGGVDDKGRFVPSAHGWQVTEGHYGLSIVGQATAKEDAIQQAAERLSQMGRGEFDKRLVSIAEKYGPAPRWGETTAAPGLPEPTSARMPQDLALSQSESAPSHALAGAGAAGEGVPVQPEIASATTGGNTSLVPVPRALPPAIRSGTMPPATPGQAGALATAGNAQGLLPPGTPGQALSRASQPSVGSGGAGSIIPPNATGGANGGASGAARRSWFVGPNQGAGFEQFWNRSSNVIAHQGQAGQELAGLLKQTRDTSELMAGSWVANMPTVRKLAKADFDNFVDVAEGKAAPKNADVALAAQEWMMVRDQVYQMAKASGLDIGNITDYFPHRYDPDIFKNRDKWAQAIDHLLKTGQAADVAEAEQILRGARDVVRNRRYGNLELPREIDLPGYERTKDALFGYIESAAKRIASAHVLGKEDEAAMRLITKIGAQGGDASAAKNLFDIATGAKQYGEIQQQISGVLRAYNIITKLGLGALTNAGQSLNTATVTGGMRTLLNTPKAAFSPEAKDYALRIGVTLDGVISDLREGAGYAGKLGSVGAPGFNTVEKFNRTLAALAGREYAADLAQQAAKGKQWAIDELGKLGLDGATIAQRGTLTPGEQAMASRSIVERTQFKVDPQDLPGWTSSPWGKVVAQFRTFAYNQTAFIGRELIQPAMKGNIKPLIRFLVYGLPIGAAEVEVQNFLRNRPDEEDPVQAIRQWYQRVGGIGVLGDILSGMAPPNTKYLPAERYALQAAGTMFGPSMGTYLEGVGSVATALQGKPEGIERWALKQIPVVGPTIKNTLLPYKPGGRAGTGKNSRKALENYLNKMSKIGTPKTSPVEKYLQKMAR
jgi:hypothetical protein